jgi:3-phosphoinositide dependent protein kinase-1
MKDHKKTENGKWDTFVGSQEYVSPEVLKSIGSAEPCDIWSLGCLIYQLFVGKTPFSNTNEYDVFQKIIKVEYEFPEDFPEDAKDLVNQMLRFNPSQRLGCGSIEENLCMVSLKAHRFFFDIDFANLEYQISPLIKVYEDIEK